MAAVLTLMLWVVFALMLILTLVLVVARVVVLVLILADIFCWGVVIILALIAAVSAAVFWPTVVWLRVAIKHAVDSQVAIGVA